MLWWTGGGGDSEGGGTRREGGDSACRWTFSLCVSVTRVFVTAASLTWVFSALLTVDRVFLLCLPSVNLALSALCWSREGCIGMLPTWQPFNPSVYCPNQICCRSKDARWEGDTSLHNDLVKQARWTRPPNTNNYNGVEYLHTSFLSGVDCTDGVEPACIKAFLQVGACSTTDAKNCDLFASLATPSHCRREYLWHWRFWLRTDRVNMADGNENMVTSPQHSSNGIRLLVPSNAQRRRSSVASRGSNEPPRGERREGNESRLRYSRAERSRSR